MNVDDFDFELPQELIAQFPLADRSASRLLVVNANAQNWRHQHFTNFIDHIQANDLLVFNNTKVIPARMFGQKATGGKIECLLERIISDQQALVHLRSSKSPKPGAELLFAQQCTATMIAREGDLFLLEFSAEHTALQWFELLGDMPLPPYIERAAKESDKERYQTVYAKEPGAVAAPTAGLHFDEKTIQALKDKGVASCEVTLHVGAGTFQPVRVDNIKEHHMHSEWMEVDDVVVQAVADCRARGGRVIAIGTTSVRCLESASDPEKPGFLRPFCGDTDIFIYPGYQFKTVDVLLTNFHLPRSTLLMLVSALAGRELMLDVYNDAVKEQYRFFSYGDAMLIEGKHEV